MAQELRTTAGRMGLDPWRAMGGVGNKKDEQRPTARWWVCVWCGRRPSGVCGREGGEDWRKRKRRGARRR